MDKFVWVIIAFLGFIAYKIIHAHDAQDTVAVQAYVRSHPNPPMGGNPSGDVTVIEFFDYRCGYCKMQDAAFYTVLREDPYLRVVYMEYPIFGGISKDAARAALAVNHISSARYYAYHQALIGRGQLSMEVLTQEAGKLGISSTLLQQAMADPAIDKELADVKSQAHALDIRGTPGVVIGSHVIKGDIPIDRLRTMIAEERKQARN